MIPTDDTTVATVATLAESAESTAAAASVRIRRNNNVRIFATVFVTLVCSSILSLHIFFSWNLHRKNVEDAQIATANLSRALAEHAEATLTSADAVLFGIVQRLEVEGMDRDALARLYPLLASYIKELPQLQGLFIYDHTGKWLVNSMEDSPWLLNNSDREYFIFHMTHEDRQAHIGLPIKSRSTGDWIIPVSRRINLPDGRFGGVALATIPVQYLLDFYTRFDIGRQGEILLGTQDGILLAQRPLAENSIGKNIRNSNIISEHIGHNKYGVAVLVGEDGVKRLYSYKRLGKYPLFITAALSYQDILSGWRTETLLQSIGVLILVVMLAWLGQRLVNQIKLRSQAQQKLLAAREKLVEMNKTLKKMALEDSLTGVANRRQFDATLSNEYNRARRERQSLALLMLDVDHFKKYNDSYGHPAGDVCLKKIGKVIQMNRPGDLSARYGGEEFAILLPHTDLWGAINVGEKICQDVRDLQIPHNGNPVGIVTISIGVHAVMPESNESNLIDLISVADKALYTAKARGRNQVCCGNEALLDPVPPSDTHDAPTEHASPP
jgi:diguanylate cyclase (GGDEF)-like protein